MFLITAYPRSGTLYTAELLSKCGLSVAHENIATDGCVSWLHVAHGTWLYNIKKHHFDVVLHQVRDPLKVISSAMTLGDYSFDYMYRHIKPVIHKPRLKMVMHTWIQWNEIIEKKTNFVFQVEKAVELLPLIFEKINIPLNVDTLHFDVPVNINTRKGDYEEFSWEDIYNTDFDMAKTITHMAKKYGYNYD